jgi:large subunit ribosomal protein L4
MATTLPVKTMTGADGATVDIQESWLERIKGEQAVKDSVVAFLARMRSGTAATKTRGLVSGGGSKPWRQKGTGRARAGSSRSPVWRGGGTVFGPQPRSYEKKVNMKVEKLALRRAFTDRIDEGEVILVDELSFATPKTKEMTKFLAAVGAGDNVLVIVDDYS